MALIPFHEWLPDHAVPAQLFVLLHTKQSDPESMTSLAAALRAAFPDSVILAPASGQLGDSTINIASHVGHKLHPALVARAIVRLQTCVPLHSWKAALGATDTVLAGATLH